MKVKTITLSEEALEARDYQDLYEVEVDGKTVFSVGDGEPEDNTLSRNFASCFNVIKLMKMAYEAGVRGETFEVEDVMIEG